MNVLITGASGMLGRYLLPLYQSDSVTTLGRSEETDIRCDLRSDTPDLSGRNFELVIHAAGTIEESDDPAALNLDGTLHLLDALSPNPPRQFIFVSSHEVYSRDAGEDIDEQCVTWATSEVGRSKARAEVEVEKWGKAHDIIVTILRPAMMFGDGVHGIPSIIFSDVASGRYIHIRGNVMKLSIVTALDTARAIRALHGIPGIFNVSDGRTPTLLDLTEAMSINAGHHRRMTHLPIKWARAMKLLAGLYPPIADALARAIDFADTPSKTLSNRRLLDATGLSLHDTIEVIARKDKNYPYLENE